LCDQLEKNESSGHVTRMEAKRNGHEMLFRNLKGTDHFGDKHHRLRWKDNIKLHLKEWGTWWGIWSRHYAVSRNVAGSSPDVVIEFSQFT
jgi:hypothetical protein